MLIRRRERCLADGHSARQRSQGENIKREKGGNKFYFRLLSPIASQIFKCSIHSPGSGAFLGGVSAALRMLLRQTQRSQGENIRREKGGDNFYCGLLSFINRKPNLQMLYSFTRSGCFFRGGERCPAGSQTQQTQRSKERIWRKRGKENGSYFTKDTQ